MIAVIDMANDVICVDNE